MTIIYPYSSPIILTDTLFVGYGGQTGTSTASQRQAAYLISEKQMTSELNTFLLPTTVTGTYAYPLLGRPLELEYGYLHGVNSVNVRTHDCMCDCSLLDNEGCHYVLSDTYGYIYVKPVESVCSSCCGNCGFHAGDPFDVVVSYTAGLTSGSSYQADMLLALTMVAQINLNEIIDPGANEGVGDVGIQSFSNQSYSEDRIKLKRTAFGTSARANKASQLVNHYRKNRVLKLGW